MTDITTLIERWGEKAHMHEVLNTYLQGISIASSVARDKRYIQRALYMDPVLADDHHIALAAQTEENLRQQVHNLVEDIQAVQVAYADTNAPFIAFRAVDIDGNRYYLTEETRLHRPSDRVIAGLFDSYLAQAILRQNEPGYGTHIDDYAHGSLVGFWGLTSTYSLHAENALHMAEALTRAVTSVQEYLSGPQDML